MLHRGKSTLQKSGWDVQSHASRWELATAEPVEDEVQMVTGGVEAGPSVHHGTTDGCGRDGLRV